ncbi:MAG: sulfotransferase family 2 domain-containing protein [Desulfobacterales bacterium]|jgi:hypothetical protein
MIVSKRHKFIFAAFNKTGSSSVQKALWPYQNRLYRLWLLRKYRVYYPGEPLGPFKHLAPRTIKELVGDRLWKKSFKFAFVRNPWSRLVSLYHYHRQKVPKHRLASEKTFDEWLRLGGTGSVSRLMAEFMCDENGKMIIDFVGRFENLKKDFDKICRTIGIKAELPHINRSRKDADYRLYYTSETRDLVRKIAQRDIELFGYEF